ncbi:MAG TPA: GHKL domain-containing protein [Candidatus Parabacteroides intestinigallinarum]|uniref:histidine kinase n=1 Tax=Candidatus Parabacteroides intestinigallinarum TaxID=2838722 RepID=A0A9D1XTF3_9BACT|nr:GHKL domain-containing protein [Candidatus Parabacteroides intestinigallinarum]
MVNDLHIEIEKLKKRIVLCERVTLASLVGIIISIKFGHQEWIWLLILILACQIGKLVLRRKLKQKEYLVREVEERTREIRSEKDAIQEESDKLARALKALAEAQDELVRKERMATVGQLTKGLVDRILNPLNYINNFASLTSGLANELRANIESQKTRMDAEVYEDSIELLNLMSANLGKISGHGFNTVRIVKAMEELLKDRHTNLTQANINDLCRIELEKLKKTYEREIREWGIHIAFKRLSVPILLEVNVEQIGKVLSNILRNAIYAIGKKRETTDFAPEISLGLKINLDRLEISIQDNGTGIDEPIKDKIFAPFFTTKPTGEATGIGLYLCREIIQDHRGTIEVESQKGAYTRFVISLPIYQTRKPETPKENE